MTQPTATALALFADFDAAALQYAHFKSNEHLLAGLAGETDLDVLVARAQADLATRLLAARGFKRMISQSWARYPGIEDWLGFDWATGQLLHIHLHFALLTGARFVKEQRVRWESVILETAVRDPELGVRVTDPSLELLLLGVRLARKGGALKADLAAELKWLRARMDREKVAALAARLLPEPSARVISALMMDGDLSEPSARAALADAVEAGLGTDRRFGRVETRARARARAGLRSVARVQRKLALPGEWGKRLYTGGRLIAFVGSDGAGKSTVTKALARWLGWKLDCVTLYLGSGDGAVGLHTRALKGLARGAERQRNMAASRTFGTATEEARTKGREDGQTLPAEPLRWLKQAVKDLGVGLLNTAMAEERARKLKRADRLRASGVVVLTDRFPQRQVRGVYDGPRTRVGAEATVIRRALARVEDRLYEEMSQVTPDLVLRLKVSVEVALARKAEHTRPEIERKVALTEALKFPGAAVVDLDAGEPLETVILKAKRALWAHL